MSAVAWPIKPPLGGMFRFGRTDAGMLIIFDPAAMDSRQAIELVAALTGYDLVEVTA